MTLHEFADWLEMNQLQIDRLHPDAGGYVLVVRKEAAGAWSRWPIYEVHGPTVHRTFLALMAEVAKVMP